MLVTIFCDASYCHEQKVAGYGYWIAATRGKFGGGDRIRMQGIQNNTVAEMIALVNSLYVAITKNLVQDNDEILFTTDCLAAIDAFEGKRKHLNGQEIQVLEKMTLLQQKGKLKLRYRHVKGHTGKTDARSVCNKLCDKRAKQGLKAARAAKTISQLKAKLQESK